MPKLPAEVYRQRERTAWTLRTERRWTQQQIADELGIKQPSVCRILKRVRVRAEAELTEEAKQQTLEQVASLEHIAKEAMLAWGASKETARTVTRTRDEAPVLDRTGTPKKDRDGEPLLAVSERTVTTVRAQSGNAAYLQRVMDALEDIRDILGIEAPRKIAPTTPTGEEYHGSLDDPERLASIVAVLERARKRRDREADTEEGDLHSHLL